MKICNECNLSLNGDNFSKKRGACKLCRNIKRNEKYKKESDINKEIQIKELEIRFKDAKPRNDRYNKFLDFLGDDFKNSSPFVKEFYIGLDDNDAYIVITPDILSYMGYNNKNEVSEKESKNSDHLSDAVEYYDKHQKYNFVTLLNNNEIDYKEESYDSDKLVYYLEIFKDVKHMILNSTQLKNKKIILMTIFNLKMAVMCLNTKEGKEVRKYLINLESEIKKYINSNIYDLKKNIKEIKDDTKAIREQNETLKEYNKDLKKNVEYLKEDNKDFKIMNKLLLEKINKIEYMLKDKSLIPKSNGKKTHFCILKNKSNEKNLIFIRTQKSSLDSIIKKEIDYEVVTVFEEPSPINFLNVIREHVKDFDVCSFKLNKGFLKTKDDLYKLLKEVDRLNVQRILN